MDKQRRRFLKVAGFTVIGLAGAGPLRRLVGATESAAAPSRDPRAKRWAMVVDPRRCLEKEGCTACVEVCDRAHNVPRIPNHQHEVRWIWKEPFADAFLEQEDQLVDEALTAKPLLVFCNHCDNPPCVRVCPTQATWRRDDGIVMMDWHRCIGCRYCMAGCPYGSRSFNWEDPRPYIAETNPDFPTRCKGVVEKCTFCDERVDQGKVPACVAACPEKALTFGDLNDPNSEVRRLIRARYALRRKPELGTRPSVFYLV
ncbi:MAG: sulfate reduction electron transfer complex DsrMKJOP subunit DsrO [Acidobacteriota bacterium]